MAQATESLFDLDLVPNNTGGANTVNQAVRTNAVSGVQWRAFNAIASLPPLFNQQEKS